MNTNAIVTNTDFVYPCSNCDAGFASLSSDGCKSCTDTCERYAKYLQRQIEDATQNRALASQPNYEVMYNEQLAKTHDLQKKNKELKTELNILEHKLTCAKGAIAMVEVLYGRKWMPNALEVIR